jgi:hypothetical protein
MLKKSKKKVAKKVAKKSAKPKKAAKAKKPIGQVTHFFNEISVAIVKFNTKVPVGKELHYKGATTDFKELVKSMQYDHNPIDVAPKGKEIGIKVKKRVRQGDEVHFAE